MIHHIVDDDKPICGAADVDDVSQHIQLTVMQRYIAYNWVLNMQMLNCTICKQMYYDADKTYRIEQQHIAEAAYALFRAKCDIYGYLKEK